MTGELQYSAEVVAGVQSGRVQEFPDHIRVPISITPSGVRTVEDGRRAYRPEDELVDMVELMNGLPIFIGPDHPPLGDIAKMTGVNVADPDYPLTGILEDVVATELPDGRKLASGWGKIFRKDRAGNDRTQDIDAIKAGKLKNVSPGMYTHYIEEAGTDPRGEKYDIKEWGTKPTHLQILTVAPPDCHPPLCTIHVAPTASSSCSCPDEQEGDQEMPEPSAPPKGEGEAPAKIEGVAVQVPPAVVVNVNGQAPMAQPVAPAVQSGDETGPAPATPEAPAPEGDGTPELKDEERAELEALRKEKEDKAKEERTAQVKAITEGLGEEGMKHYFPEGVPEDMCQADVERWVQVAGDLKEEPEPAPEAPAAPETPAPAPAPAAQSEPEGGKVFRGLKIRGTSQSTAAKAPKGLMEAMEYKPPVGPDQ